LPMHEFVVGQTNGSYSFQLIEIGNRGITLAQTPDFDLRACADPVRLRWRLIQ
jgi:hypothetical protein